MKSEKRDQDLLNKLERSVFDYDITAAEHSAKQVVERRHRPPRRHRLLNQSDHPDRKQVWHG